MKKSTSKNINFIKKIFIIAIVIVAFVAVNKIYAGNPVDISPGQGTGSGTDNSTYNLLAPIGNLKQVTTSNGVGDYLNVIFKIAIGLAGALAVIMIVIGGIQYMGTESVFGKTEAKGRILSAILGLLIALGAYAILYTINPDLTGANGVTVDQVTAQIDPEVEIAPPSTQTYTGSGDSKLCTTGYTDVPTYGSPSKINVCNSLGAVTVASNLKKMIDAAKVGGLTLSGYGSRAYSTQVQLRISHHCGDTYNAPSNTCIPPTARPGHSNHEVGGAVDFTCDGSSITSRSNKCFAWLNTNATTYHFSNLPSEPWHWSINGK